MEILIDYDSRDEDEWFYNSINRYKELVMFDTEYIVNQIEFSSPENICILGKKIGGQYVLSELKLPAKIVNKNKNVIALNNDLKIKSGAFSKASIYQILCVYGEGKLLAVEECLSGVAVYDLNNSDSDQILRSATLMAPLLHPNMCLVDAKTLLLTINSECDKDLFILLDICSGECIIPRKPYPMLWGEKMISTMISPKITLFTDCKNSASLLYDVRNGIQVGQIMGAKDQAPWAVATNYQTLRYPLPSTTNISLLSKAGMLRMFDIRKLDQELLNCKLKLPETIDKTNQLMRLSPAGNYLSISGYDTDISVYHIEQTESGFAAKEVFKHDGHNHMDQQLNHTNLLNTITDHQWYDNWTIISAGDNMSLNCWQPTNLL